MVSVCITAYNHEKYIAQAIESVLAQKVDFDYEILIGEDDSPDRTRAIVSEYHARFPDKIRLFLNSRENVVYINGRVTGLWNFYNNFHNAKGKYIALLDGDDYWTDPNKLQKQIVAMEANSDCTICFHDAQMLMDNGAVKPYLSTLGVKRKSIYTIEDILFRNFLPTGAVVFRNRFIREIPEAAYQILAGDWFLHITNAQYGDILYIDDVMSCYRVHQQGLWTSLGQAGMIKEKIHIYKIMDRFLSYKYSDLIRKRLADCESELIRLKDSNHA
ncbi:glycosyltransferase [Geobacter pelophilus]|uniref:Glycosyltransferase n=2 Tax=Geoanaerobacter pelophilus TaxID=60036 RepID=A0AAW4L333_9BACT|nr:glycosyltransferase [Geoanaerobacter pelophilus]